MRDLFFYAKKLVYLKLICKFAYTITTNNNMTAWNKIVFTDAQNDFLIKNFHSMTNQQLADSLGLKLTTVRTQLYKLGYKRMELEYWNDEQILYLRENYKTIGDTEIAEYFNKKYSKNKGWTKKHIEKKRRYLKLKRTPEEKQQIHARNKQQGRFADCAIKAWKNRGVMKVGTKVTWCDNSGRGYVYIKTDEGFKHYAPILWQEHYGEIPKGHNVCFIDGNRLNCTIENLVLRSNAELAVHNSKNRKQYPTELRDLQNLLNKLTRKINSYGTKQDE